MSEESSRSGLFARLSRAFGAREEVREEAAPETPVNGEPGGDLILNVRLFHTRRVEDVMVPRADVTAVEIDTPLSELARIFDEAAHSRLPIYRDTLDDPVGVAHIRDVLSALVQYAGAGHDPAWGARRILPEISRPLLYVPASMRAPDLLLKMQSRRIHMALVVDEFGGTDGLVTLEDLLEPIVGDIEDEHDEDAAPAIRAKGAACWEADARAAIDDFEAVVGREIATVEEEEDVDTLGGLVFRLGGRVPERGEVLAHPSGFEFEVLDSDPRRIKRLRVRPAQANRETAPPADAGDAGAAV